jgi:hypothetical protein
MKVKITTTNHEIPLLDGKVIFEAEDDYDSEILSLVFDAFDESVNLAASSENWQIKSLEIGEKHSG